MTPEPDPVSRNFRVDDSEDGLRLDHFLTARCEDLSRSQVQKAVAADGARVDGATRPSSYRLSAGQRVEFTPPSPTATTAEPEDIPLVVIHQDEDILVVDKPAGMVVHPAPGHREGTLVNALLHRFETLPGGDGLRAGLVHRLDKDTSGLLVVALSEAALRPLQAQLQDRTLGRTYEALSWGQWAEDAATLTGAVGRHPTRRQRMAILEQGGKPAVTHYEVREDFGFVQYCRVRLETGRTHQIRVHFAHHHHPVVGDATYGDDARIKGVHPLDRRTAEALVATAGRQMLHACELRLVHPRSGEALTFAAPRPDDFQSALDILRDAAPSASD
ncbi:RluA family pseudouridine synthase [bacterium]|nr:RluA family pseudouridine synthase [bacterium]